jgi:Fur family peroxide stress response transcriptional regulator
MFIFHHTYTSFLLLNDVSSSEGLKGLFKTYYYLIKIMSRFQKSEATIIDALRKRGFRATPQRIAICRLALNNRNHPTAQKIYDEVREFHPTVSLATVYKTLQMLTKLGLIQELDFPEEKARFDSYVEPHINLVCSRCGIITDLDDPAMRDMIKRITATAKFTWTGQRLDIYGICKTCSHRNK